MSNKRIETIAKPSGTLIVAVPILNPSMQNITALLTAYDVPIHLALFKKAIKTLLKRRHAIRKVLPKFDFYVSLLSENTNTENEFVNAFIVGLQSNMKAKQNSEYSSHIYVLKNK
jgi:hypothetical protein